MAKVRRRVISCDMARDENVQEKVRKIRLLFYHQNGLIYVIIYYIACPVNCPLG